MSKFKRGNWVKCIDAESTTLFDGAAYQIDAYDQNTDTVRLDIGGMLASYAAYRFEPYVETPTLSDFDRIRLETAMHFIDEFEFSDSLEFADKLINLIISTPFKRSE